MKLNEKTVVLLQRMVPHYRKDFYYKLAHQLKGSGIRFFMIHSSSNVKDDDVFRYEKPFIDLYLSSLRERSVFSPFLFFTLSKLKPDLILSEGVSNLPNGLVVMLFSKFKKIKYGIMGLGKILGESKKSLIKKIFMIFANCFRQNASLFIAYSDAGKDFYQRFSPNSISYYNSIVNADESALDDLEKKYEQFNELKIVFVGRVEPQKKLDLLIDALNQVFDFPVVLNVIGDGSDFKRCKDMALNENIKIMWHGKITDQVQKKDIFKDMHLGVMPGSGGLVIQELQAYAIPVVTSYSDGTEIDLVKEVNPDLFMESVSVDEIVKKLNFFYDLSVEQKNILSKNAYDVILSKYNLDNMVRVTAEKIISEI